MYFCLLKAGHLSIKPTTVPGQGTWQLKSHGKLSLKTTLETSEEDLKLHSKRVKKMENYTPNGWRRWKTTLQTGEEDGKLHSKRVKKMENYTPNEWRRWKTTLQTGEEDGKLHSKRVKKMENYTQKEWAFTNRIPNDWRGSEQGRWWLITSLKSFRIAFR